MGKEYLTPAARQFLMATKVRAAAVMRDRGFTVASLSRETHIPLTTLTRWLDNGSDSSMTLPALQVIADKLGVSPQQLLPDHEQQVTLDRDRHLARLLTAPEHHLRAVAEIYGVMARLAREG